MANRDYQRYAGGTRPQVEPTRIDVPCSRARLALGQPERAYDPGVRPPGDGCPVPPGSGQSDRHRLVPGPNPESTLLPVAPPSLVNRDSRLTDIRPQRGGAQHDRAAREGSASAPGSDGGGRLIRRLMRSGHRDAAAASARHDQQGTGGHHSSVQPNGQGSRSAHLRIASQSPGAGWRCLPKRDSSPHPGKLPGPAIRRPRLLVHGAWPRESAKRRTAANYDDSATCAISQSDGTR